MATRPLPTPLRTEAASHHAFSIARAITGMARETFNHGHAKDAAKKISDPVAKDIVTRGAVTPADTGTSGWASTLAATGVATLATMAGGASAFSAIASRSMSVNLDGSVYGIKAPTAVPSAAGFSFTKQGDPARVAQLAFDGPTLTKKKALLLTVLTRETIEHTDADTMVRDVVSRSLALGIESVMFDGTASDDARPAGVLYSVDPIEATAGGTTEALITDLANLGSNPAKIGGLDLIYVCGPAAAIKVAARAPLFKFPVFASGALADDQIVCLAPSGLVIGGSADPVRIETSIEAVLHMEDTSPTQLTVEGTPAVAAFPARSVFQTDCVAVRVRAEIDWALRASGAVSWIDGISW